MWKTGLKAAVSIGVIAYVLHLIDPRQMREVLSASNVVLLAGSTLVFFSKNLVGAWRWRILLVFRDHSVSIVDLTKFYFIGAFFGFFLPTAVGGDVGRGYYLCTRGVGKAEAIASMVFERLCGVASLIFLSLLALTIGGWGRIESGVGRLVLVMGIGFVALVFILGRLEGLERVTPSAWRGRLAGGVRFFRGLGEYARAPRVLAGVFMTSVVFQLIGILAIYMISLSLGCEAGLGDFVFLVPIVAIVSMLPVSLNGLGVREGAFVYLFAAQCMTKETAVAVSALFLLQTVLQGLLGSVVFIFQEGSLAAIKRYAREPSAADVQP